MTDMPRTTIAIDGPILAQVQALSRATGKTLGETVTELLREALRGARPATPQGDLPAFDLGPAKVDLRDKELVQRLLDAE